MVNTRNKYNVKKEKEVYDDIKWDSRLELNVYKYLQSCDDVFIYELQPKFKLLDAIHYYDVLEDKILKQQPITFKSDFLIKLQGYDKNIVIEAKGMITQPYTLRKKLWYSLYGKTYYFIEARSLKDIKEKIERLRVR